MGAEYGASPDAKEVGVPGGQGSVEQFWGAKAACQEDKRQRRGWALSNRGECLDSFEGTCGEERLTG